MLQSLNGSWFVAFFFVMALLTGSSKADTLVIEDGLVFFGSSDVLEDVVVRAGGVLFIDGTWVDGCIRVEQGGALLGSGALIMGEVRSDRALLVELSNCEIGGDVELRRTGGVGTVFGLLPQISVFGSHIAGDLRITRSDVQSLTVANNTIEGRLELARNRSVFRAFIQGNEVLGNRRCN